MRQPFFKVFPFFWLLLFFSFQARAQKDSFSAGFESSGQWYLNDTGLKDEYNNPTTQPQQPIRSNSYLLLQYKRDKWNFGLQGESYLQNALLNMNPAYEGSKLATYFGRYTGSKIDVTAGYFYEQFGSGMLFRSWEDRALGINNAIRGLRVLWNPYKNWNTKWMYGKQRSGFDVAEGTLFGADISYNCSGALGWKTTELSFGTHYVGRYERTDLPSPAFNPLTSGVGIRMSMSHQSFYSTAEYNYKTPDAVVQSLGQVDTPLVKPGSALLANVGYTGKGLGIDATFRRLENMGFYSERAAKGNVYNDKMVNYLPSLTKQHHYNLANIYVYQAQPNVLLAGTNYVKAGEIGGQIDLFYEAKKGSFIGGKHGMKLACNFSNWNALSGTYYIMNPQDYKTNFIGFGQRMFSDYNIEITKKWSTKWTTNVASINQYYNKKYIEDASGEIRTHIVAVEAFYKLSNGRSWRWVGEHMWADYDRKNWASATIEFNINSKLTVYAYDMYNYGNELDYYRNHYYNIGGSYRKKSLRLALNYGRQRGGLVCVGGVCRFVPESSGVSATLTFSL